MPDIETQLTNLIDKLRWNISRENEEAHYLLDDLGDLMDRLIDENDELKAAVAEKEAAHAPAA